MSAIERGLYVTVGAADLAVEKIGEIGVVAKIVEQSKQLQEKSIIDRARELEPKLRSRTEKLQVRGEKVVKRLRKDAKQVRKQIETFPKDARQQLKDLPEAARQQLKDFPITARKQVTDLRGRIEKAVGRPSSSKGAVDTVKKPAAAAKSS